MNNTNPINIDTVTKLYNYKQRNDIDDIDILIKDINNKIEITAMCNRKCIRYTDRDVTRLIWYRNLDRDELDNIKKIYETAGYKVTFICTMPNMYTFIIDWV